MNGFLFSGPTATRPAALSAAVASGGNVTKSRNRLAELIADQIVRADVRRLKSKPAAAVDLAAEVDSVIARFRAGGAS